MELACIAFSAISGGIVIAIVGWLESGENFNGRKFGGSIIRAMIAGIIFAVSYKFSNGITGMDFFYAFLGGAGFDVFGNRIAGNFGKGSFPIPTKSKKRHDTHPS
jgi:hypothetical protein